MRIALALLALSMAALAAEEKSAGQALLDEGWKVFRSRRYAESVPVFHKAVAAAEAEGDERLLAEALSMTARGLLASGKMEEGRKWLARAAVVAKPSVPLGWSTFLGVRGRFEWKDGENGKATKTFETMYAFTMEHEQWDRAVDAAHMVAITGTPEQQVEWAKKGIAAAEKGGMEGWLGPLWNNLGATHEEAGRYEEALACYRKARHYHWKHGDERNKLVADWAVGHACRLAGKLDEAARWLRPVLAWAERLYAEDPTPDRGEWVGLAAKDLGQVMAARGKREEALALLRRAKEHLGAAKMAEWDPKAWKEILAAIEALGK